MVEGETFGAATSVGGVVAAIGAAKTVAQPDIIAGEGGGPVEGDIIAQGDDLSLIPT